jgi:hypothetical protein
MDNCDSCVYCDNCYFISLKDRYTEGERVERQRREFEAKNGGREADELQRREAKSLTVFGRAAPLLVDCSGDFYQYIYC